MLRYPRSSETFFKGVITVVKLVPSSQGRARVIRKLNHCIYSRLINPRPTVVADRWRHNTSQDSELLAKSYNDISDALIADADLLRLSLHISALGYLEEGASRFTKLPTEDEQNEDDQE